MSDKVRVNITGGGVFSKVMIAIQNIEKDGHGLENCYFNIVDHRALGEDKLNPLDSVLNQSCNEDYRDANYSGHKTYNKEDRIYESPEFEKLKAIATKLNYKQELKVLVDDYVYMLGIDQNTIGVHIRLCDMNIQHGRDYGYVYFDDYVKKIKKELNSKSKIFVASDNEESILKLQKLFGSRILYVKGLIRAKTEAEDSSNLQLEHLREGKFWQEAFLEMLLLSKCSKLICRTSNLANMVMISSNTIQKIIML